MMGARAIAARDEGRLFLLDRLKRPGDVLLAFDAGGIALRPDQHEIVVHHRVALHAFALGEEFFFRRFGMHEYDVGIPAPAGVERLASSLRDDFHVDAGLLLEQRQNVAKQPGILRRCGRRHHNRFVLSVDRRGEGGMPSAAATITVRRLIM